MIYFFGCSGSLLLMGFPLLAVSGGYSLVAVCGLLTGVASPVEHRLEDLQASVAAVRGLSSCHSQILQHRLNSCGTGT